MTTSDPRCHPLIDLSLRHIETMLRPVSGGARLREAVRVEGGLVNTTYRVTTDGGGAVYALRVYAAGRPAFEIEHRLLPVLAAALPVPEPVFADASGTVCAHPYLVYRWIEGITLNECRRLGAPETFLTLAEPLGRLLARIAGLHFPDTLHGTQHTGQRPSIRVAAMLERAEEQLRAGRARERLGGALADSLRDCLNSRAPALRALERADGLVHGDCGGRNILVRAGAGGGWEISGLIDWEGAAAGCAWWDVGSLFRYPRRYSPEFRTLFARGYGAAGGRLPPDWWRVVRLLDCVRVVAILDEERELPGVFAECGELIGLLTADVGRAAA